MQARLLRLQAQAALAGARALGAQSPPRSDHPVARLRIIGTLACDTMSACMHMRAASRSCAAIAGMVRGAESHTDTPGPCAACT